MAWGSRKVAAVDESSEQTYARAQARWKDDTRNRDKMLRYKAELAECRASLTSLRGARAARPAPFLRALRTPPLSLGEDPRSVGAGTNRVRRGKTAASGKPEAHASALDVPSLVGTA